MCCLHPCTKRNNKIFVLTFRCAVGLWKSWVCKYSIRFQVIKLKLLGETLKNEKFLLDIQTKCGDITNKIVNRNRRLTLNKLSNASGQTFLRISRFSLAYHYLYHIISGPTFSLKGKWKPLSSFFSPKLQLGFFWNVKILL